MEIKCGSFWIRIYVNDFFIFFRLAGPTGRHVRVLLEDGLGAAGPCHRYDHQPGGEERMEEEENKNSPADKLSIFTSSGGNPDLFRIR